MPTGDLKKDHLSLLPLAPDVWADALADVRAAPAHVRGAGLSVAPTRAADSRSPGLADVGPGDSDCARTPGNCATVNTAASTSAVPAECRHRRSRSVTWASFQSRRNIDVVVLQTPCQLYATAFAPWRVHKFLNSKDRRPDNAPSAPGRSKRLEPQLQATVRTARRRRSDAGGFGHRRRLGYATTTRPMLALFLSIRSLVLLLNLGRGCSRVSCAPGTVVARPRPLGPFRANDPFPKPLARGPGAGSQRPRPVRRLGTTDELRRRAGPIWPL
jgi:hypothetical protein